MFPYLFFKASLSFLWSSDAVCITLSICFWVTSTLFTLATFSIYNQGCISTHKNIFENIFYLMTSFLKSLLGDEPPNAFWHDPPVWYEYDRWKGDCYLEELPVVIEKICNGSHKQRAHSLEIVAESTSKHPLAWSNLCVTCFLIIFFSNLFVLSVLSYHFHGDDKRD